MRIKGKQGEEIEVNETWTDARLKTFVRCVAEDAERYAAHEALKASPDYHAPVFADAPLSSSKGWR